MHLPQLEHLPFVKCDGFALVQGVFRHGRPHGWTVIRPLTGTAPIVKTVSAPTVFEEKPLQWTHERSLEIIMTKKTKTERLRALGAQLRLALQVEIRQLKLEQARLEEGKVKYEERTAPVRGVEDRMFVACTRLQKQEKKVRRLLSLY